MGVLEVIGAICLIITCFLIVVLVMFQDPKGDGLAGLAGGGADSYFDRNSGRTMDAKLSKFTRISAIVFFVVTILVYAAHSYL